MMKYPDESLCIGKDGTMNENGDHIFNSQHFKAVFDGATPKGKRLWEGVHGDVYASRVLSEAMRNVESSVRPSSMISYLNDVIKKCYAENGVSFEELPPEERLQVSAIIYSVHRREVWCFGDCSVKINNVLYKHTRAGDKLLSDLCCQLPVMTSLQPRAVVTKLLKLMSLAFITQAEYHLYIILRQGILSMTDVINLWCTLYTQDKGMRYGLASYLPVW